MGQTQVTLSDVQGTRAEAQDWKEKASSAKSPRVRNAKENSLATEQDRKNHLAAPTGFLLTDSETGSQTMRSLGKLLEASSLPEPQLLGQQGLCAVPSPLAWETLWCATLYCAGTGGRV